MNLQLPFPLFLVLASCLPLATAQPGEAAPPLPRAHAHNDYAHQRPLLDALAQGFCSVEADIFLVGEEFRVGHSKLELRPGRTLESLYLEPLAELVRKNKGSVYSKKERFLLLIDIKSDADEAYPALDKLLTGYEYLFTAHLDGKPRPGPITAILSGNRPHALGRPPDLGTDAPAHLIPLVSDNWNNHFKWRGRGEFPAEELAQLKQFVARTHNESRLLRFWAVPDHEACWRVLHGAGVDLINSDKLRELAGFLRGLELRSEYRPRAAADFMSGMSYPPTSAPSFLLISTGGSCTDSIRP